MTVSANLAAYPPSLYRVVRAPVRCRFDRRDLPCGLQIMGKPFDEKTVLAIGYAVEASVREEMEENQAGCGGTCFSRRSVSGLTERAYDAAIGLEVT